MDQNETTLVYLFGNENKRIEYLYEIEGGTGEDVLDKKCRVLNGNGEDVTQGLINGDGDTTALLKRNGIRVISEEDLHVAPKVFKKG